MFVVRKILLKVVIQEMWITGNFFFILYSQFTFIIYYKRCVECLKLNDSVT